MALARDGGQVDDRPCGRRAREATGASPVDAIPSEGGVDLPARLDTAMPARNGELDGVRRKAFEAVQRRRRVHRDHGVVAKVEQSEHQLLFPGGRRAGHAERS
jgi:hypothetical protein